MMMKSVNPDIKNVHVIFRPMTPEEVFNAARSLARQGTLARVKNCQAALKKAEQQWRATRLHRLMK